MSVATVSTRLPSGEVANVDVGLCLPATLIERAVRRANEVFAAKGVEVFFVISGYLITLLLMGIFGAEEEEVQLEEPASEVGPNPAATPPDTAAVAPGM